MLQMYLHDCVGSNAGEIYFNCCIVGFILSGFAVALYASGKQKASSISVSYNIDSILIVDILLDAWIYSGL